MNIGFDLDKIFIDTPPLVPNKVINWFYKKHDNNILSYRIPKLPEQLLRKATHLSFMRPEIKKNLEFLKKVANESNNLYLISSRYNFLSKETENLVKKYNLDKFFKKLYFNFDNNQPHLFKNEVLKKLKLDKYIDDDLSLLKFVAKDNPKTKFYWLNSEKNNKILHNNIESISNLEEIFKK